MRVRKICVQCKKLKSRLDYPIQDNHEGRSEICNACLEESSYEEYNNKINKNNPLNFNTMSLKEKREAAAKAAAEVKNAKPVSKETKPVAKKPVAAPVEEPKKVAKKSEPATEPAKKPVAKKEEAKTEEKAKPAKAKKVKPTIGQYDLATGKLIKTHTDVDAAAASIGKHKKYIDINAKNGSVSAYGFKWLYEGYEMPVADAEETEEAKPKAVKKTKVEDKPVPGDLDYDPDSEEIEEEEEDEFVPEDDEFENETEDESEEEEYEEEEEESEEDED
jgi:hypothetical protein